MKAYLIDDEQPCLDDLAWQLSKYPDVEVGGIFTNSLEAVAVINNEQPDVVFLDIDMPYVNGLEIAQMIQAQHTGVIVIFVTAYTQYALDAYKSYPLDFLIKPVPDDRLNEMITHLRKQYALLHPQEKQDVLKIKCFGPFEVLFSGEVRFPTRRVKELLLYLIGRHGVAATRSEMLSALFAGRSDLNTLNNLYVTLSRLKTLLDSWDNSRKLVRLTEDNALLIAPGVCDYTDFMCFAKQNAALSQKTTVEAARILALCKGPYLEKETYDWAAENALEVEDEYERIALALAAFYVVQDRFVDAESVLCELLAHIPLCSDGYTAILDLYIKNGNHTSFIVRYEEYTRMLKREFQLKPLDIYRNHYRLVKH